MTTCTDCNELVRHCTCGMTRAERNVCLPAPSYAADGQTPLHYVPGRELLVSAVAFNGKVAEVARLQAQVDALSEALWVTTEHSELHFGANHNTVIHGRAAIASVGR